MRAQTQPIPVPPNCDVLRLNYVDEGRYRDFKTQIQRRTDDLGAYVTNGLDADLQTAARNADPQVMYERLVKYVRLELTGQPYLYAKVINMYDERGETLALRGTATASSIFDVNYSPTNALSGQSYFYTKHDTTQSTAKWWQFELQTPSRMSRIYVSNVPVGARIVLQNGDRNLIQEFTITNTTQEFTIALPQTTSDVISQKMNALKALETEVQSVLGCLQKEIIQRENISSDIYNLHQQAKEKKEQVKTKDINVRSSKERAAVLRDPYAETTVWESWFPLGRPLEKSSVPVLWTMALIFLLVSLALFLYMAGFGLEIMGSAKDSLTSMFKKTNAPVPPIVAKPPIIK
jgi:hypothetical protein